MAGGGRTDGITHDLTILNGPQLGETSPRPVDFIRLSQATYIDSQTIALVDVSDCHVWVWSRRAGLRELNKSCGEGPNELVRPITVTSSSGILRVVDGGTNSIVSYGPDLAEISRILLPAGIAGEYVYSADDWVDDSITMSVLT